MFEMTPTLARHAFDNTDSAITLGGLIELSVRVGVTGFRIETVAGGVKAALWDDDGRTVRAFGETEYRARYDALDLFIAMRCYE